MNARALIEELAEHDIHLSVSNSGLRYCAPRGALTPELRATLKVRKAEIIALLAKGGDGWDAKDWRADYEERCAIIEYDGGLPRPQAEARAFECCVVLWLNRHYERTDPTRCAQCGQPDNLDPGGTLLPFGTDSAGHAWLHSACWPAWHAARQAKARAALAGMGIVLKGEGEKAGARGCEREHISTPALRNKPAPHLVNQNL